MRRRADDPDAPREVLAAAALRAVATNEPVHVGVALARRAFAAGPTTVPQPTDLPWFAQASAALVWADAFDEAAPRSTPEVAESRATGDCALFATSMAWRAWMLLRRGDLQGAAGDARTVLDAADLPAPRLYRTIATAVLVTTHTEQGDPDAAEAALRSFAPGEPTRTQTGAVLLLARGHLRVAQRRLDAGLADIQAAGDVALRTGAVSPAYLLWRSAAALVQLALGEREAALALAHEELELGRVSGAPRVLGAALRTAGVVTGGPEGEELLREAVATLEGAGVALESARALVDLGALLRRSNRRAEARELLREGLDIAHRGGAVRARRPGRDRAAGHRRQAAPRAADRPRGPHGQRAAGGRARGAGDDQSRDRPGPVRHRPHRGGPPDPDLPEARPALARGPRAALAARRSGRTASAARRRAGSPSLADVPLHARTAPPAADTNDHLGLGEAARSERLRAPRAAHAHGRPGGEVDLPVLRGGLRPARLRQGREGHPDRGRSGLADLARAPVPQGLGLAPAARAPGARVQGQVPPRRTAPSGRSSTSTRRWT